MALIVLGRIRLGFEQPFFAGRSLFGYEGTPEKMPWT
jgi:hypothetical protein